MMGIFSFKKDDIPKIDLHLQPNIILMEGDTMDIGIKVSGMEKESKLINMAKKQNKNGKMDH
jgi:hypothetical protein